MTGLKDMMTNPSSDVVERLGEALFNLSDSLRPHLGIDLLHERYKATVAAWQQLEADVAALERLSAERLQLREALKPSGDTKAAYSGEFSIDVPLDGYDEDGEPLEGSKRVLVPWTTIKEIMAAISDREALSNTAEDTRHD